MDEELFKRMQEAALRFKSGESDFEEIMTPAGPAHLVRDESDPRGFRIDFVGDGSRVVVPVQEYPAAPTRPPGYPAPLPFLESCPAVVDTTDQSVTWPDPPDPRGALDRLARASAEDGWTPVGPRDAADDAGEPRRVLVKDGVERALVLTSRDGRLQIVMRERRVADSTDAG